jgi:hypothetical protein
MTLVTPPPPLEADATPPRLPLRFRVPPGWPEPNARWQAEHQGWEPPAGWILTPALSPAPPGWVWWEHDEAAWAALVGRSVRGHVVALLMATLVTAVSLNLATMPEVWQSGWRILVGGALAFGPLEIAHRTAALASSRRFFASHLRRRAALLASTPGDHVPEGWFRIQGRSGPVQHRIRTLCISGALAATLIAVVGATLLSGSEPY